MVLFKLALGLLLEPSLTVEARKLGYDCYSYKAQKDHINIRILQTMASGIPLYGALRPECRILMFTWSFGPLPVPET